MKNILSLVFFFSVSLSFGQQVNLLPYRLDSLWGYADTNGVIVIKPQYQFADFFTGDLAKVKSGNKVFFINSDGKTEASFNGNYFPECNLFRSGPCNYLGLMNREGDTILSFKYDEISASCDCNFFVSKGADYLLFNAGQKKISKLNYDKIYIDTYGDEVRFNLLQVKKNNKYGYLSCSGMELIPPVYDECYFNETIIEGRLGNKVDLFDIKGKKIISSVNGYYGRQLNKNYVYKQDNYWLLADSTGKNFLNQKFDTIGGFNYDNEKMYVGKNGKFGVMDINGKIIFPIIYDYISPTNQNLFIVGKENKFGVVDTMNNLLIPINYPRKSETELPNLYLQTGGMYDKYIIATFNGKTGFVDAKSLKEVIPFKYDYVNYFIDGFARVSANGKIGFIDTTGKEVVPIKYDSINDMPQHGLYHATRNNKSGYIDLKGHEFFEDSK